jgi:hypothetical protein
LEFGDAPLFFSTGRRLKEEGCGRFSLTIFSLQPTILYTAVVLEREEEDQLKQGSGKKRAFW